MNFDICLRLPQKQIEQNKNISGLVILTDGIITSGGIELFNPMNVPVYSIGMGDTVQIKDAMVNKVYHNEFYNKKYFRALCF